MNSPKYFSFIIFFLLLSNCATYKAQYNGVEKIVSTTHTKDIVYTFYLIGDGGNSPLGSETITLKRLKSSLKNATKISFYLIL